MGPVLPFPAPLMPPSRSKIKARLISRSSLAIGILALLAVSIVMAGPPVVPTLDLPTGNVDVAPNQPLEVSAAPLRLAFGKAVLLEIMDDDASHGVARPVPVHLVPLPASVPWAPIRTQVVGSDGLAPLRPDASYQLTIDGNWGLLALPWLKFGPWKADYHFTTLPSPKPLLSDQPARPRYKQPVKLAWDAALADFQYRVSPEVPSAVAIDADDPRQVSLNLQNYLPGATYRVEVLSAKGANGVPLQHPFAFSVEMPKPPTPALGGSPSLRPGELLLLQWDEPIVAFEHRLDPSVSSTTAVDPSDHRRATITVENVQQGKQYRLTVTSALAENGTSLSQPYSFTITTPPALAVVDNTPDDERVGVAPTQTIHLVFAEPVDNRVAAERALAITPTVAGHLDWPSDRELRFVPAAPFPFESDVTVRLAGGLSGPRSIRGGYIEKDVTFAFKIRPNKVIDVDLARQVVTLKEGDRTVLTSLTSTGARGDETPTGTFIVRHKIPSTRMRGVTASGGRYDVPDVPWVLVFWGDYTIHGAYWRRGFGFPQSAGCVSLPVPAAKQVYDWAPRGTPVFIHY